MNLPTPPIPPASSVSTHDGRPLHLPAGQNYECIRCGRSCGEFWEILVEPEKVEEIRARPADALAAARDPSDPIVESPFSPGRHMMRLIDGCCSLRTGDGLCSLHAAFGLKSKPNVCRSFPYRFVETPDGVFTGISFACTAVLGNLGPAVAGQSDAIRDTHAFTVHKRAVAQPPNLTVDLPLDWEQYAVIEADLDALLSLPGAPLAERLLAQSVYLALLSKFLREARSSAGASVAGPEAHHSALNHFHERMRGEAGEWPRVRSIAGRRRRSALLRRTCLGVAHELRNVHGRRRGRLRSYVDLFSTYFLGAVGRGRLALPSLKRPVEKRRLESIAFDPDAAEMDELLTRYFRHRLFRKDLVVADDVQFGMQMQMLHWGLMQWYAAAFAIDDGRAEVGLEDLREALRNVEKYYVMHSTFERLFADFPVLRGFLDRLFGQPLFAFSMARGDRAAASGPAKLE
jgi:Fe-S-cluster containining protein